MADSRVPVLLDTDIGTNIDDALALAYLLREPRCDLLGVTTVSGQAHRRAALAAALCGELGRPEVPVWAGASAALDGTCRQAEVPLAAVLGEAVVHPAESEAAIDFMYHQISERPGRVTLLSIGPLTNVARLYERYPDAAGLLGRHVMMGGVYWGQPTGYGPVETNMRIDPEAADKVLEQGRPIDCVGLDATTQCRVGRREFKSWWHVPRYRLMREMAVLWLGRREEVIFHDPLAAVAVFDERVVEYARGRVSIELADETNRGRTRFEPADDGLHRVVNQVFVEMFFRRYRSVVD